MTALVSPVGKVTFTQLEEPRSFKDDPETPKKYSISVEFEGEAAKSFRSQLIDLGKPCKLVDGKLKITFSRHERLDKPRLVDNNKEVITDRPPFLPKGTEVKVQFIAKEFPMCVALMLEAVMIVGELAPSSSSSKEIEVTNPIDPEFLAAFS
jgi:hypothetical protein